jgi:hypothetical protein
MLTNQLFHNHHTWKLYRSSATNIMTTTGAEPEPPYLVEMDGPNVPTRSHYLSISFHPSKRNMSFEELRLRHYITHHEQSRSYLGDASKLMVTRPSSSLNGYLRSKAIRAAADGTQKYVMKEVHS